jgi:hypothetical protein
MNVRLLPPDLRLLLLPNSGKGFPHVGVEAGPVFERRVENRFHCESPLVATIEVSPSFVVVSSTQCWRLLQQFCTDFHRCYFEQGTTVDS